MTPLKCRMMRLPPASPDQGKQRMSSKELLSKPPTRRGKGVVKYLNPTPPNGPIFIAHGDDINRADVARTRLSEFQQGALVAVSLLIALHDQPVAAADVVSELGLSEADCTGLDDYDKNNLKKIQGERSGSIKLRGL